MFVHCVVTWMLIVSLIAASAFVRSRLLFATGIPVITTCLKCGTNPSGKRSCCASGGSWVGECGDPRENTKHTWFEGIKICRNELAGPSMKSNISVLISDYTSDELAMGRDDSIKPKCTLIVLLFVSLMF